MTPAMQTAVLERASNILHEQREGERTRERASSEWWRRHGSNAAPVTIARMNRAIGEAVEMLREIWDANTAAHGNEDSRRRLDRIKFLLDEFGLPAMEFPRQRPLAAMSAPKPKPKPRPAPRPRPVATSAPKKKLLVRR